MRMVSFLANFPEARRQHSNPLPMHRRPGEPHGLVKHDFLSTSLKARRFGSVKGIAGRLACMTAQQKPP